MNLSVRTPSQIYCDKAHYGPVSGGGAVPRVAGFEAMMVTGGN